MADDLLVGIGADVAQFQRDAQEIVAIARNLQRDIARAMAGTEIVPDLSADARAAGTQLITGLRQSVQEGGDLLRRDVAAALVPVTLAGEFSRLADTVRAGTTTISTSLAAEGHDAGRALVTGLAAELPAAQQVLSAFARSTSAALSGRLLTDLTPEGTRAGHQLIDGLRAAIQAERAGLTADVIGSLIPTNLTGAFARLTTEIANSASSLADALGAGGEDAARRLITGLAGGLVGADRIIEQFAGSVRVTLSRANLLGDLERQGAESGQQLIRGVTASITSGSGQIQRAVVTALVPTNLPGQLGVITTSVDREIARITPLLAATGTTAGRALVLSLGAELSAGTAVIVRDFSRGAQTAVAGLDIFGDLTPAGQRAGTQLIAGLVQVVNREGQALQGTLATALIPTTLTGNLARLATTVTAGLQDLPPLFLTAGRESGAAFTASLTTQLAGSRALLTEFGQTASAALTAAITVGDTGASGERAGRELAGSIASGVAAEAPRVRAALSAALLPSGVAADVGRVVETVKTEAATLIPAFGQAGRESGAVMAEGIIEGLRPVGPALRALSAGETIGVVVDSAPIVEATRAQQGFTAAVEASVTATRDLSRSAGAFDVSGMTDAQEVAQMLAEAEQRAAASTQNAADAFIASWAAQQRAAQGVAEQVQSTAVVVFKAAQQETNAFASVSDAIRAHIDLLKLYAGTVEATNTVAVAGWTETAALVRENARAVGIEGEELFKLDGFIRRTAESFRLQAAEARNAQRAIASQATASTGGSALTAGLGAVAGQANKAKAAVAGVGIAGKSMQQITTRLGPALVGVGFGLEALARGGAAAEGGLRTALRAVASFAVFFGEEGFIVAGVAAATAAIIDLFSAARDEMEKTRKAFDTQIDQMIRNADFKGIQRTLQELQQGTPSTKGGLFGGFAGGLDDMEARANAATQAIELLTRENQRLASFDAKTGLQKGGPFDAVIAQNASVLRELAPQITEAKRKRKELTDLLLNPPQLPREIQGLPTRNIIGESDAKQAKDLLTELAREAGIVQEAFKRVNGDANLQAQIIAKAIPLYDTIKKLAQQHKGEVSDTTNDLAKMLKSLTDIDAVSIELTRRKLGGLVPELAPVHVVGIVDKIEVPKAQAALQVPIDFDTQAMTRSLQTSITQAASAQNALDFAKLFGKPEQIAAATKGVDIATVNMARAFLAARDAIQQSADSDETKIGKLKALSAVANAAGVDINALAGNVRNLSDTLNDVGGAARGIAAVVGSIRGVDDELVRAIDSAAQFADALSAASSVKFGGSKGLFSSFDSLLKGIPKIGEAIAGAIGLVKGIADAITGAAEKAANRQILKENNEQLERLRQDLRGFSDSIGGSLGASRAISGSSILDAALRASRAGLGVSFKSVEGLDRQLREAGSSIAELKRRAEELGITIVDASGRISAQGLSQLNDALKLAAKAAANFENNLESLRTIQNARRDIFELDSPTAAFNDALKQIADFAPQLFQKFLAGANVDTPEARQAAEQSIRDLFDFITKQGIDLTPFLGGFASVEDFLNSLLDADHALDGFKDTAKEATGEMVNVVKGFKDFNLERARFQATANDTGGGFLGTIPKPNPVPIPADRLAQLATTIGSLTFAPTIKIDGRDKDAVEITTEVLTELRRRAKASANPDVRRTVGLLPN